MSQKINSNLASELKNFDKGELNETKTSENVITPVTGKWLYFCVKYWITHHSEVAREKVLVELGKFSQGELDHVETIEKNILPSVDDLKQCRE